MPLTLDMEPMAILAFRRPRSHRWRPLTACEIALVSTGSCTRWYCCGSLHTARTELLGLLLALTAAPTRQHQCCNDRRTDEHSTSYAHPCSVGHSVIEDG